MNGIHDMGGMQGLGEIRYQETEPIFHEPWEGRVYAMDTAMRAHGLWRGLRAEIELLPASEYLRMSYYERWMEALIQRVVKAGLATPEEIERGRAEVGAQRATPALTAAEAREVPFRTPQTELDLDIAPRFEVGERVRVRNIHPPAHTRLPRYTRGKVGTVERDRGIFPLPDTEIYFEDPRPQHVYMIRFDARELWGEGAPTQDKLYIDMWEDYLEPA